MENNKWMLRIGAALVIVNILTSILMIVRVDDMKIVFGSGDYGPLSIYSSRGFFIAYHVWTIIISGFTLYAGWKEKKVLFLICLILLTGLMFYPWYSAR